MILRILVTAVLSALLASCGGSGETNDPSPQPSPTPSPSPESNFERGSLGDNDTVPEIVCDSIVTSTSDLQDLGYDIAPGTTTCLANGNYSGLELGFGDAGTAEQPIKVAAETSGGVTIGGEVSINMSGTFVQLQGFIFRDGTSASSDFLQTRGNGNQPCHNCRISEISIINFDQGRESGGRWLKIYGSDNRVDHNWFSGKTTTATLLEF